MPEIDVLNLAYCIISIIAINICLLAILLSYRKFRLVPILFYFAAFSCFLIGVIGIIPSTLIFDPARASFITFSQSITFGLTFIGLLLLFLGINASKGSLPLFKTNLMSFFVGGTILGYLNYDFYHLTLDITTRTWEVHYHTGFLLFISLGMLLITIELISYARIVGRSEVARVRLYSTIYFAGWLVLASSGLVFFWSRLDYQISANLYLIPFSLGVFIISLVIFFSPASLIASPLKIFNLTFVDNESGLPYLSYDFRKGETHVDTELFSGVISGISLALKETVKGKRYLRTIDGIDRKILLERGLQTQAVLTVEDETILFRRMLKRLLILFEMGYYLVFTTSGEGVDPNLFVSFTETIKKYFAFAF